MASENRHQMELLPSAEPHKEPVTRELIASVRRRPTFLRAWNFAQEFAGLEDKQCYTPLQIDSSHWTKIKNGSASPPADERFTRYLDVVQNEIPLIWLAESRGYDWLSIRRHQSDEQRRIAELDQEVRDLRRVISLFTEAQRSR